MKFSTATTLTAAIMVVATTVATTTAASASASTSASDPRTSNTKSAVRGGVPVPSVRTPQQRTQRTQQRTQRKLQNEFSCPLYKRETQMEDHEFDYSNWACEMEDGQFIDIDDTVTELLDTMNASSGTTLMKVISGADAYVTKNLDGFEGKSSSSGSSTKIQIPNASEQTLSVDELPETDVRHYKSRRKQRQLKQLQAQQAYYQDEANTNPSNNNYNHRNLAPSAPGTLDTLVVRVISGDNTVIDASPAQLRNDIFEDAFCLATGYAACSKNQLIIAPIPSKGDKGIVDVRIDAIENGSNDNDFREQAVTKLTETYGRLDNFSDLVMLCLPEGTGNFVAYAYVNSYLSVYNSYWCQRASAQMHEVGHNLGLGHSNEGTQAYGDQSSMMGYSYNQDDGPKMCFNPAKGYQLGWYDRQKLTFDPLITTSQNNAFATKSFILNGVINYNTNSQQATLQNTNVVPLVSLRLKQYGDTRIASLNNNYGPDFYVGYNRQAGINSGTIEAKNQITVHRKESGAPMSYGESNRLAALSVGQQYTIDNYKGTQYSVTIKVNSITNNLQDANIEIITSGGDPNAPPPPTPAPVPPPTPAPAPCNGQGSFVFKVSTDPIDDETSWSITNSDKTIELGDTKLKGGYLYTYSPICLNTNNQKYTVDVTDARGYEGYLDGQMVFQKPFTQSSTSTASTFCIGNCDTSSPTSSPTPAFNNVSTESPTESPPQQCIDESDYLFKNKQNKDCEWVGKGNKRKKIRKKCKKKDKINGKKVRDYCQETCAEVNQGPCKNKN